MRRPVTPRERWVDEGIAALAAGGPDAVRVEAIAGRLGVTKGGFYGYFADRQALLDAVLDRWEQLSVDDVLIEVGRLGGQDERARAVLAGRLTFAPERLPADLAVRDWARRDPAVAERLQRVDAQRLALLRNAIGSVCTDPVELEARCLIAFSVAIASGLLSAPLETVPREQALDRVVDILFRPST